MLLWRNKESLLSWAKICIDCSHMAGLVCFLFFFELARVETLQDSAVAGEEGHNVVQKKCGVGFYSEHGDHRTGQLSTEK